MSRKGARTSTTAAFERVTSSEEETQALGQQMGKLLASGDVVALHGELGSGKTTLIQGIVGGLGGDLLRVKSPTFVLVREYPGNPAVIHIDGYRLEGSSAAAWLDVEFLFSPSKVTLVEWAEKLGDCLPEERLEVFLEHVSTNRRRLRMGACGARASRLVTEMEKSAPLSASEGSDGATGD